jgi:hypothetical protein
VAAQQWTYTALALHPRTIVNFDKLLAALFLNY